MPLTNKTFGDLFDFTRASTKWVFDETGTLIEVPVDTPAYDHDPLTGDPLGVLIEESRTNVFTKSEAEVADGRWGTETGSSLSDSSIAGRPAIRATLNDDTAGPVPGRLWARVSGNAGDSNNKCWRRVIIRVSDPSVLNFHFRISGNTSNSYFPGDNNFHATFDPQNGNILYTGGQIGSLDAESLGNNAWLLTLEQTGSSSTGIAHAGWVMAAYRKNGTNYSFEQPAQNGDWFEFTACQREELVSSASSYIPTASSSVTRAVDIIKTKEPV